MGGGKIFMTVKGKQHKRKSKKRKSMPLYKRTPTSVISTKADFSGIFRAEDQEIKNDAALDTKLPIIFKLDDILNAATWKTVWDQYRIDKVTVKFIPNLTEGVNRPYDDTTNPGDGAYIPSFIYMIDRDDNASTDFVTLKARPASREVKATRPVRITFVPNRLYKVKVSATTQANVVDINTKAWIDSGSSDVTHYGLKTVMEAASPAKAYNYKIEKYYHISFKGRRI